MTSAWGSCLSLCSTGIPFVISRPFRCSTCTQVKMILTSLWDLLLDMVISLCESGPRLLVTIGVIVSVAFQRTSVVKCSTTCVPMGLCKFHMHTRTLVNVIYAVEDIVQSAWPVVWHGPFSANKLRFDYQGK
jgi:hypothetical protein